MRGTNKAGVARAFELVVTPDDGEGYGLTLFESKPERQGTVRIAELSAKRAGRVLAAALEAVRTSGNGVGVLSSGRKIPVRLEEEPGVRLALVMLATGPVSKPLRVDQMVGAVQSLTAEEAYYWYAKCVGPDAQRMRRAFRLFLAEE